MREEYEAMKILIVSSYGLYGNYTSSFVHNQAKAYAALGHRVRAVVLLPYPKASLEGHRQLALEMVKRDGVEVLFLRCLSLSNWGARGGHPINSALALWAVRFQMPLILRGFSPDVVHAHALETGGVAGVPIARHCGIPLVITIHGSDLIVPLNAGHSPRLKAICDQANAVVAVSSMLQERARSCGTVTPVYRILNGFLVQNVWERQKKRHQIIQAGNLTAQKKFDITLRAVAELRPRYPDVTLKLVGNGEFRRELESLAESLNIQDIVTFTGSLDNWATQAVMAESEIFAMPSIREGFGIVYLEAMANGCLTIGSNDGGITDVIHSGVNGFLIPPGDLRALVDMIEWCLTHPKEASIIAGYGKRDALQLTWEKNATEYIQLFQTI